jgi:hypothetical protein
MFFTLFHGRNKFRCTGILIYKEEKFFAVNRKVSFAMQLK